jgi:hypothetical protein
MDGGAGELYLGDGLYAGLCLNFQLQIWGFEEIDGELYQTRRIVTATAKGQYVTGRQVLKRE